MTGFESAGWGALGAFAVEGLEFAGAIRSTGGWPWRRDEEPGPLPFAVSVLIRLAIGAIVAGALGAAGQFSGSFGALSAGIGAPLLVQQLARQVPREPPATAPQSGLAGGTLPAVSNPRPAGAGTAAPIPAPAAESSGAAGGLGHAR